MDMIYRGEDRRASPRPGIDGRTGPAGYSSSLSLCLLTAIGLLALTLRRPGSTWEHVDFALAVITLGMVLVGGVVCVLRWRLTGAAPALWTGVALGVVTVHIGIRHLAPVSRTLGPPEDVIASACLLTATVLILRATLSTPVASTLQPVRVATVAAVTLLLSGVGVALLREVAAMSDRVSSARSTAVCTMVAWATIAVISTVRARRRSDGWTFPALAALGAAFTLQHAIEDAPLLLALIGALVLVRGTGADLQSAFAHQQTELFRSRVSAEAASGAARRARELAEERAHEARNALVAIDSAVRTLQRHHETLPTHVRKALSDAAAAELARLQCLVAVDAAPMDAAVFDVAEAIAPAITGARASGLSIRVDLPPDLVAVGSWSDTAAVVQNLLENVRRHAAGSSALVRGWVDDARVLVEVADRGPGVPVEQQEAVFRRGVRGVSDGSTAGCGLGLHVARTSMLRHGGELRYVDRDGGGASFRLELVRAPASAGDAITPPGIEMVEELPEVGNPAHPPLALTTISTVRRHDVQINVGTDTDR